MSESQDVITKVAKKRSQSDKIGRQKYNQQLLKRVLERIERVQKVACADEVDQEILELLFQSQPEGLFPKGCGCSPAAVQA